MKEGHNKTLPSLSWAEFEVLLDTTLQTDYLLQDSLVFDKGCHAALLNRFILHCISLSSEFISLLGGDGYVHTLDCGDGFTGMAGWKEC